MQRPPVFIRRDALGAHGRLGHEERALSIGYSSITVTAPQEEGLYKLQYDSMHPLNTEFEIYRPGGSPAPPITEPLIRNHHE